MSRRPTFTYTTYDENDVATVVKWHIWGSHRPATLEQPEEWPEVEISEVTKNGALVDYDDDLAAELITKIMEDCEEATGCRK
jgi:hypothetical protein